MPPNRRQKTDPGLGINLERGLLLRNVIAIEYEEAAAVSGQHQKLLAKEE